MNAEKKRYLHNHLVSLLLALFAAIVTIISVTILIAILEFAPILSDKGYVWLESVFILFLATAPCYFICKKNPDSVWYVPLIENLAVLLLIGIMLTGTWNLIAKTLLLTMSVLLASLLSIAGRKKGKQLRDSSE